MQSSVSFKSCVKHKWSKINCLTLDVHVGQYLFLPLIPVNRQYMLYHAFQLRDEAKKALAIISTDVSDAFNRLFIENVAFQRAFDHYFQFVSLYIIN